MKIPRPLVSEPFFDETTAKIRGNGNNSHEEIILVLSTCMIVLHRHA